VEFSSSHNKSRYTTQYLSHLTKLQENVEVTFQEWLIETELQQLENGENALDLCQISVFAVDEQDFL
jgi:hypothetical protein